MAKIAAAAAAFGIAVGLLWLFACSHVGETELSAIPPVVLGKSKQTILACAGPPLQEVRTANGIVLKYYREAPMLEESMVASKGSRPGIHRGAGQTF